MFKVSYEDKRRDPRIKIFCPVVMHSSLGKHNGMINNVSMSGFGVESADKMSINDNYLFEFFLPEGPAVKASGELLWRIPEGEIFGYGVRIKTMGLISKIKLKIFIWKILRRNLKSEKL